MKRIKELRESNGMKQGELAVRLSISRPALSFWENGVNEPDTKNLVLMAKLFNVSVDYLLELTDDPVPAGQTPPPRPLAEVIAKTGSLSPEGKRIMLTQLETVEKLEAVKAVNESLAEEIAVRKDFLPIPSPAF